MMRIKDEVVPEEIIKARKTVQKVEHLLSSVSTVDEKKLAEIVEQAFWMLMESDHTFQLTHDKNLTDVIFKIMGKSITIRSLIWDKIDNIINDDVIDNDTDREAKAMKGRCYSAKCCFLFGQDDVINEEFNIHGDNVEEMTRYIEITEKYIQLSKLSSMHGCLLGDFDIAIIIYKKLKVLEETGELVGSVEFGTTKKELEEKMIPILEYLSQKNISNYFLWRYFASNENYVEAIKYLRKYIIMSEKRVGCVCCDLADYLQHIQKSSKTREICDALVHGTLYFSCDECTVKLLNSIDTLGIQGIQGTQEEVEAISNCFILRGCSVTDSDRDNGFFDGKINHRFKSLRIFYEKYSNVIDFKEEYYKLLLFDRYFSDKLEKENEGKREEYKRVLTWVKKIRDYIKRLLSVFLDQSLYQGYVSSYKIPTSLEEGKKQWIQQSPLTNYLPPELVDICHDYLFALALF
jgi:hypothetical protein